MAKCIRDPLLINNHLFFSCQYCIIYYIKQLDYEPDISIEWYLTKAQLELTTTQIRLL